VSLCKSIATQLLDAGAPLHKVFSFLGHSDPKITDFLASALPIA